MSWTYEVHELSEGYSAIVYDETGKRVADHLPEEQARLIAAAPELLEALSEEMEAVLEDMRWADGGEMQRLMDRRARLFAVIAKAGGAS